MSIIINIIGVFVIFGLVCLSAETSFYIRRRFLNKFESSIWVMFLYLIFSFVILFGYLFLFAMIIGLIFPLVGIPADQLRLIS